MKSNWIIQLFHKLRDMSQLGKYCWLSIPSLHWITFSPAIKKKSRFSYLKQTFWKWYENVSLLPEGARPIGPVTTSAGAWNAGQWWTWLTKAGLSWCEGHRLQADETPWKCAQWKLRTAWVWFHAKAFWEWVQNLLL